MRYAYSLVCLVPLVLPAFAAETGRIDGRAWIGAVPAGNARIILEGYGGSQYRGVVNTDSEGRFLARDVPAGKYRLARLIRFDQKTDQGTSASETGTHGARVEVVAGRTVSAGIGGGGRTVIGRLAPGVGLLGRRLAYTAGSFRFLTRREPRNDGFPGRVYVLQIGENGTVRCPDVPPGEYDLLVSVRDGGGRLDGPEIGRVSRTVTVPPSKAEEPHDLGRLELEADAAQSGK